ncbi:MAG: SHOCT domain-containing protein [Gammaproteobacteria bacterium]
MNLRVSSSPLIFILASFISGLAAPAARALDLLPDLGFLGKKETDGTYLMEGGQQYVKLVRRDKDEAAAGPNDHPAEYSAQQLETVLGAITMQHVGGIITEKQEALPLFTPREAGTLALHLSRGLERAQPEEDIVFVVAGVHAGLISKERKGTSGRAFVKGDRLNLILGEVHKDMVDKEQEKRNNAAGCGDCPVDERLYVFRIPSRNSKGKVPEPITVMKGLDFARPGGKTRDDWLILDVPVVYAAIEKQRNRLSPAAEKAQREAKLEAARAAAERRQMREEMARMRKEMDAGRAAGGGESVEDRLATLDTLKKKGLITPEEYESRRRDILKDI